MCKHFPAFLKKVEKSGNTCYNNTQYFRNMRKRKYTSLRNETF